MKKIGLIGGMSWESSLMYYRIINEEVRRQLGGFHSCRSLMESVDFAEIEHLQHRNNWEALNTLMAQAAMNLEKAGADVVVLCTNTMHLCSDTITSHINIPFLHIARATGEKIKTDKVDKVLLLGTKFTMESDLYKSRLAEEFGIETIIPLEQDRATVHQIIYEELVHGIITGSSRKIYIEIINRGMESGAAGVILGCTEIPLLIRQDDVTLPVYDTTRIHAEAAVALALENNA
ncbi:aspartate/glutamate racemase family protein [Robertkochia flava]|uniref:aspartate/glutamate racemase family protein n=1 Tax=Robertkochia flava TaxID=3447986 RepID=UPI001CCB72BC|nr:aspartate/glutamate racemase family protein [Robertkochia marina]